MKCKNTNNQQDVNWPYSKTSTANLYYTRLEVITFHAARLDYLAPPPKPPPEKPPPPPKEVIPPKPPDAVFIWAEAEALVIA